MKKILKRIKYYFSAPPAQRMMCVHIYECPFP